MLVSVSMSGQGYVSSALARYLIKYFIDTFLVDPRQTLVWALEHLEGGKAQKPSGTGNGGQTNTSAGATKAGGRAA